MISGHFFSIEVTAYVQLVISLLVFFVNAKKGIKKHQSIFLTGIRNGGVEKELFLPMAIHFGSIGGVALSLLTIFICWGFYLFSP